jgi:hypothetical protein
MLKSSVQLNCYICMWIKISSDTTCCILLSIKYIGSIVLASTRPSSGHYKNLLKAVEAKTM